MADMEVTREALGVLHSVEIGSHAKAAVQRLEEVLQ